MKLLTIISIFIFTSPILFCQEMDTSNIENEIGKIEIKIDSRIVQLIDKKGEVIPPATEPQISGYRIQLFFDTEKKHVDQARTKFITMFPTIETTISYKAPNYFLKVGNFRTFLEAEKIKGSLDKDFPTNYILKELINLPSLD